MTKLAGKPKTKKQKIEESAPNPAVVKEAMEKLQGFMGQVGQAGSPVEVKAEVTPEKSDTETPAVQTAVSQATTTVTAKMGGGVGELPVKATEEVLGVHKFVTDPARVNVDLGLTINLGNYESARISIGLSIPCYKEEVEKTFSDAKAWLESKIKTEVSSIRKGGKALTGGNGNGGETLF